MPKTALIDLQYLPSLEYFAVLFKYDKIIIEKEEHFVKQTFRNRCEILSANKVEKLSVPVIGGRKKIKVKDIQIDHEQNWQKDHWRAIQSAYGRAPFYEFFAHYFEPFFQKQEKFLYDFNFRLLTLCLKLLQKKIIFEETSEYIKSPLNDQTDDLRSEISPKIGYKSNKHYRPVSYPQVFGKNFVANLSIIDLLFCEGPNAKTLVTKSILAE
ncbi:MAG: WbqC family protein [Fulvivirga sp.]